MTSPKALRDWTRVTCSSYPDLEIKNMSTSFRDGLVFCAIIHRHRPDLLDFSSLSKDNVYQNNKLAFEVAETKLGIPALLDPNDMESSRVPDCLSIITYLSQYYHFFNRKSYAGPVSLKPSHVSLLNSLTKSKSPAGLKPRKSLADLKTCREDCLSSTRPRTVCTLCFKPVHLIQRHLIDGKVYHRSCFRCKVCHSALLVGSYSQESEAGFLLCTHHTADSKRACVDLGQQRGRSEDPLRCKFEEGYFSLGGSRISSVPHYTETTESEDGLVPETEGSRELTDRDDRLFAAGLKSKVKKPARHHLPPISSQHRAAGEAGPADTPDLSESSSPPGEAADRCRPVPAPRRMLDPAAGPRAGNARDPNKSSPSSSQASSSGSPKVRSNHPWLTIVHPGPWTQLPPAPAPIPAPRTKFSLRYRPRVIPPNPFAEDMKEDAVDQGPPRTVPLNPFADDMEEDNVNQGLSKTVPLNPFAEDMDEVDESLAGLAPLNPFAEDLDVDSVVESTKPAAADQRKPSVAAGSSGSSSVSDKPENRDAVVCSEHTEDVSSPSVTSDPQEAAEEALAVTLAVTLAVQTSSQPVGDVSEGGVTVQQEPGNMGGSLQNVTEAAAAWPREAPEEAQVYILPRSLSVPAITQTRCHSSSLPVDLDEARGYDQVSSSESKLSCKENPFDRKSAMPKSKTFQSLSSRRGPAPGHGFPLIRRKVQTDQDVSTDDLRGEMRELDKHLQTLEQRGVQLERNLRDGKNDKEEEQMLMEWFSLVHERNVLVRRDTELVYLTKQQKLEERQADVEYQLRCLLNKPEGDWSEQERGQEQQLMDELVTVIEERNQIISSLDQDRLREREEDMLLETVMKDKELQKEGLKDLKKSKGKFKPIKVFKLLNHKADESKDNVKS
ncbi:MICAL-like protein 1 [Notolabrus celidotus]|uniref:MICAL-like protein 1 n=1 Tax=Notolabrus celidotus TaxID=1203425 RepID=UPI00148F842E|nr:MICAL-like protein 1 [Notolabrus celidotus]XP_034566757.1 MICAL-like protein 1 [Notolabrus celidotus]